MINGLILLNLGYLLTFSALAIRDVLWLRVMLISAQISLFIYNFIYATNYYASSWMILFVIINGYMVFKIFMERKIRIIPEEIRDLYDDIFKELSTNEFLYFWNMGTIKKYNNEYLIKSGEKQNTLLLILSGRASVKVKNETIANLHRGSFIAEISFLTNEPASADVMSRDEIICVLWKNDRLKSLKKENSQFWMKLQHALTEDLIKKVKPKEKLSSQIN
mgnify:CR=1 FL=1|tara:strand:- start:2684 stop:3343 length:660 start_codon:yes stop_codon:yes gene_type:complete